MEICEKNKSNRAQVKFHQTTGSRSYPVHCDNLGEKYKDEEPTALGLFKECHYSNKKKGIKWKRRSLNLLKMDNNLSLRLRLYLRCSLSTPRSLSFFSMWGSSMCVRALVVPTLKRNWQQRRKGMQSFGRLSTP